jgi:hypothetical protein
VAIADEVVNRRSVLLRNFVLNGKESASNPLLHIHANHFVISGLIEHDSVGIDKNILTLSLHPNPASSHFTLTLEAEKADLIITDFAGRIMLKQEAKSGENISTSSFSKGIYFVQVRIGEELLRRKLVVD